MAEHNGVLLIMRHAQSGPPKGLLGRDYDRSLDADGELQPALISRQLNEAHFSIDRALISTALRTRQTWDLLAQKLPKEPQVFYDQRLYNAPYDALWEVLLEHDDCQCLLLLAHNPSVSILTYHLSSATHEFKPADVAVLRPHGKSLREGLSGEFGFYLERIMSASLENISS